MHEHELMYLVGKTVEIVRKSGSKYRGRLQRTGRLINGEARFALQRVTIINKLGGETTPKHGETRRISRESIHTIKEITV